MKISLEFPQCSVCRTAVSNAPDTCDWCMAKVHEDCMGPDHPDEHSGDIYRYCLDCERTGG